MSSVLNGRARKRTGSPLMESVVSRLDNQVTVCSISENDFRAALRTPKCDECTQLRQIVGRLSSLVEALEAKVEIIRVDVVTKKCGKCGRMLTPDSFYDHPLYPDGLFPNCIICVPDTRMGQEVLSVDSVA